MGIYVCGADSPKFILVLLISHYFFFCFRFSRPVLLCGFYAYGYIYSRVLCIMRAKGRPINTSYRIVVYNNNLFLSLKQL